MRHLLQNGGIADRNDIEYALTRSTREIVGVTPAPITIEKSGAHAGKERINPHITLFKIRPTLLERLLGRETHMAVYHIKPIYYLHQNGEWRPLSEVTTYHGNHRLDLTADWDKHIDLGYLAWLLKRADLLGGTVTIPSPYDYNEVVPLRMSKRLEEYAATISFTTDTFYPDPNAETTSVDGRVQWFSTSGVWSTAQPATDGTTADDSSANGYLQVYHRSGSNLGIDRGFFLFDTAALPNSASISAATFSVYADQKGDENNDTHGFFAIVQSSPASNTALSTADYDQCGAVTSPTKGSSDIDTTGITINAYVDFALNATGIGWISLTSITKLGLRNGQDMDNADPGNSSDGQYLHVLYAETSGTTQDPKLAVTYTAGTNYTKDIADTVTLVEVIARLPGKVIAEAAAIVETLRRSTTRTILEAATAIGTATNVFVYARAMQDTITLIETTASRIAGFTHTEIITLQETLAKAMGRAISEATTMQETVARGLVYARTITEDATLVEAVAYLKSLGRVITEQITIVARVRSLLNGLDTRWLGKYASKAGTFISKYLDPKSS